MLTLAAIEAPLVYSGDSVGMDTTVTLLTSVVAAVLDAAPALGGALGDKVKMGGESCPGASPLLAAVPVGAEGGAEDPDGVAESPLALRLALALAIAELSGTVNVTVCGDSLPGPAQPVQIFSTVVMGMLGVSMAVAPALVYPQCVVTSVVVLVV